MCPRHRRAPEAGQPPSDSGYPHRADLQLLCQKGEAGRVEQSSFSPSPRGRRMWGASRSAAPSPLTSQPRDLGPRLGKAGRVRAAAWQPGRRHLLLGYSSVCTAPAAWPRLSGWGLVASGMRPGLVGPAVWPRLPVFAPTAQLPALGNAGLIDGHVQRLRKVGGGGGELSAGATGRPGSDAPPHFMLSYLNRCQWSCHCTPSTAPRSPSVHLAGLAEPLGAHGEAGLQSKATQLQPIVVNPMLAHHPLCAADTARLRVG